MQEKHLKFLMIAFVGLGLFALLSVIFSSGDSKQRSGNYQVNVVQVVDAAEGLDLRAVGELLSKSATTEAFEKALNDKKNLVNNLDLDADGKVDYIKVAEFGDTQNADKSKVQGFSLTTELEGGQVQELATIKVEKQDDGTAKVEYHGSPTVYGANHYHHSSWSPGFGTGLMMGYLFAPRMPYVSPWSYGAYPSYYSPYSTVAPGAYGQRWESTRNSGRYTSGSTSRLSSSASALRSPNAGRNASNVKASVRSPTASQRSFQSRQRSTRSKRSGGFGTSSVRTGSYGRSRAFGGK